jgi:hypothetical protein
MSQNLTTVVGLRRKLVVEELTRIGQSSTFVVA